jgi:hypothetical protein
VKAPFNDLTFDPARRWPSDVRNYGKPVKISLNMIESGSLSGREISELSG